MKLPSFKGLAKVTETHIYYNSPNSRVANTVRFCFALFYFCGIGDQTQGLPNVRKVLCHCAIPGGLIPLFYNKYLARGPQVPKKCNETIKESKPKENTGNGIRPS
jgi:hypothetical protein